MYRQDSFIDAGEISVLGGIYVLTSEASDVLSIEFHGIRLLVIVWGTVGDFIRHKNN